ncbi:Uncharacterised protein [Mycobacteroides abscessus]|nr:Uncharacterised protein [Mycobacteroides abscessus]
MCDGAGVVLGPRITHRVGTAAPDSGLDRAPKRDSLRHNVRSVYVHQYRVAADDVADGGEEAVAGTIGKPLRPVQQ